MRLGRKRPFVELVERQLDLFAAEHGDLVEACGRALTAYRDADRVEAEERYGDYVDAVDEVREALEGMRDTYAATLDDGARDVYRESFDRSARRRFREIAFEPE